MKYIAIDMGAGRAAKLELVDAGNGLFAGRNPAGKYLSIEPMSGSQSWSDSIGEFEAFTLDGNVVCFYSVNGNPNNNAWLFGCSTNVKGLAG